MKQVDIVILTIIPEEYYAVCNLISNLQPAPNSPSNPNIYAWKIGNIDCVNDSRGYNTAIGMVGRAGTTKSALAALDAIEKWHPRYLFFVGIAGGFGNLNKGDVVIADTIYGYEYGKINETFVPRHNWTFNTDQGLLTGASTYGMANSWKDLLVTDAPEPSNPKIVVGEVASGDKVVDNPSNAFFQEVLKTLPKIRAVEMEGAGAGEAIELTRAKGLSVGFMMIRGISDLPRLHNNDLQVEKGTRERDNWKPFASATAGAFLIGWIKSGLPIPPRENKEVGTEISGLKIELSIRAEKAERIRRALAIETDPTIVFKYEMQLKVEEEKITQLENRIKGHDNV